LASCRGAAAGGTTSDRPPLHSEKAPSRRGLPGKTEVYSASWPAQEGGKNATKKKKQKNTSRRLENAKSPGARVKTDETTSSKGLALLAQ